MTEKQQKIRRLGMEASYLACCAIHDQVPETAPENLDELYTFCKFHSITAMVTMALEGIWKSAPAEEAQMQRWRQARDKAIRKNVMLNAERQRICNYLESIGCWYMPLKGSFLQFDYPKFGMRQMSDNDILYDEEKTPEVHDFLTGDGYEVENYLRGNHDEYVKKPVYNMEMHRSLFVKFANPVLAEYYKDIKNRLIKDAGNSYGYHFSPEDFYIFMAAHGYKHYMKGGVGVRTLLDAYVFLEKYSELLDWKYIEKELRSIDAWEYDAECRDLAAKLFSVPAVQVELSSEELDTLDVYFTSGAYGTESHKVQTKLDVLSRSGRSSGKLRYVLVRMFPSFELMKERYRILRKHPWLAPVCYVLRLFSVIFRREAIGRELWNLRNAKK